MMNAHTNPPLVVVSPNPGEMLAHLNLLRKHAVSLKPFYPDVPDDTVIGLAIIHNSRQKPSRGISFPLAEEIAEDSPNFRNAVRVAEDPEWTVFVRACTGPARKPVQRWEDADVHMPLAVVVDRDGYSGKFGEKHPLTPSWAIQTSTGGEHHWYLLDTATTEEQFARLSDGVHALKGDAKPTRNHLYRLLGAINWPSIKKQKLGRVPEVVKLLTTGKHYSTATLLKAADTILANAPAQSIAQRALATVRAPRGAGKPAPVDQAKLEDALRFIPTDGYHDWLAVGMALKFELGPEGLPIWDAWSEQAHNYPGPAAIEEKWNSFHEKTDKPRTAGTIFKLARAHGWVDHAAAAADFPDADGGGKGRGTVNLAAVVALLESDPRFADLVALNEFTGRVDVLRHLPSTVEGAGIPNDPFQPRPISDHDQLELKLAVQQTKGFAKASSEDVHGALAILAARSKYHPLRDYLHSLQWDGVPRLDDLLLGLGAEAINEPGSAKSIDYARAVTRSFMISCVARALKPGSKVDTTLIMEGFQGLGKSTWISELSPNPDWFTDSLPKDLAHKDAASHLQGKWLVELPELSALKKSDSETIKAFLTKRADKYRPVYGRNEISWARTCVFVGSTNRSDYFIDDTGNRRFLPLRFTRAIPKGTVAAIRDQLWAEATVAYQAGEPWWLTGDVLETAMDEQAARLAGDPWDDRLPGVLEAMRQKYKTPSVANILSEMGIFGNDQHNGQASRVTSILKRLGYESDQRRIGGTKTRFWWHRDHGEAPFDQWAAKATEPPQALTTDWAD